MPRPRLVIFDCDGVLVDSEPVAAAVLRDYLEELGLPLDAEEVDRRFRGRSLRDCAVRIEAALGRPLPADFVPTLNDRTFALFREGLAPIPGVLELVRTLRATGIGVCVASSGSIEKMRLTLGLTGLLPLLDPHLFSASMVARGKPAPDLFEFAARSLGAPPADCVVIEDSIPGALAGRAAKMRTLGYSPHLEADLAETGAELVAKMADVPRILGIS